MVIIKLYKRSYVIIRYLGVVVGFMFIMWPFQFLVRPTEFDNDDTMLRNPKPSSSAHAAAVWDLIICEILLEEFHLGSV